MKVIIKLILLAAIVIFALTNYRLFSFEKGFSEMSIESKNIVEAIKKISDIEKVEYYKKTIQGGEYKYKIYIETKDDAYLLDAKQEDVDALDTLGILINNLKPEKVSPIPFYFEIIAGVIVLAIPFGKKEKD